MLTLEERLKIHIPFIAAEHNDHTGNRHVHLLACAKARIENPGPQSPPGQPQQKLRLQQRQERDLARQAKRRAIEEAQWAY